jgi:hypothetical protein
MAISGTGTGPFTVTGTETTLSIYNYVVAANATNATKNSNNTQFTFFRVLNVGDGTTTTNWSLTEQQVEISASNFTINANATMQLGITGGPRSGCYLRVNMGNDSFLINGTFRAFASRVYSQGRVRANTGAIAYHEDCSLSYLDSIDGGSGSQNPAITYIRCTQAGASAVALKLGGTMTIQDPRIYNALYAFQTQPTLNADAVYTIRNYIGINNTNDIVPNANGACVANFIGAYDSAGVPRTGLIIAPLPSPGSITRLQWTYDLSCTAAGAAAANANIRIRNAGTTDTFTGTTGVGGAIAQQTATRVDYTGTTLGVTRFPYSIKSRRFNLSSEEITWQCDNHTTDKIVHVVKPFAPVSSAAGLAITNISITQINKENAIVNSTFATDSDWTKGAGVTISGGAANCSNATTMLTQNCPLIVGQTYTLSFSYTKSAGSALRVSSGLVDNTNVLYSSAALANGSGTLTFTFVAARDGVVLAASGAIFSGTIDNFTCTRSANLVTTTASRTVLDLWQYHCAFIAQPSSFDVADVLAFNGATLDMGASDASFGVVTGSEEITTTGNITLTTQASAVGTYAALSASTIALSGGTNYQSLSASTQITGLPTSGVISAAGSLGFSWGGATTDWNATTNVPALSSGAGTKGTYYKVTVAGTTALDGISNWQVGDIATFDGATWKRTGSTIAATGDLSISNTALTGTLTINTATARTLTLTSITGSVTVNVTGGGTLTVVLAGTTAAGGVTTGAGVTKAVQCSLAVNGGNVFNLVKRYGTTGSYTDLGYTAGITSDSFLVPLGQPVEVAIWTLGYLTFTRTIQTTDGGFSLVADMIPEPDVDITLDVSAYLSNISVTYADGAFTATFNSNMDVPGIEPAKAILHRLLGLEGTMRALLPPGMSTTVDVEPDEIQINKASLFLVLGAGATNVNIAGFFNTAPAKVIDSNYVINPRRVSDNLRVEIPLVKPALDVAAMAAAVWSAATRTLTSGGGGGTGSGGATLAEIEASTVLAKQATLTALATTNQAEHDATQAAIAALPAPATPPTAAQVASATRTELETAGGKLDETMKAAKAAKRQTL